MLSISNNNKDVNMNDLFNTKIPAIVIFLVLATFASIAMSQTDPSRQEVWVSIDMDAIELLQKKRDMSLQLNTVNQFASGDENVAVVSLPESQLAALSQFMHDNFNRCGGFVFHDSYAQAQEYVTSAQRIVPSALVDYTIDNPQGANTLLQSLDAAVLTSTIDSLSAYYNRYYSSPTGVESAQWIQNRWSSISASRSDISVQLFNHSWLQPSVIATITGTSKPDEIVVIGGHLDSINNVNRASKAPGADDNATGIAIATATLKAIVDSGYRPARTIKLMGYAAEEVGLRGSNAIATDFRTNAQNVVGVVQFDMSGFKGSDIDIAFMSDYTNSAQNQFMTRLIDTYLPNVRYTFDRCGYACSDHASWHRQGYAASMPFESRVSESNRLIHTSTDSNADIGHVSKFARLSLVYVAELAKGGAGKTSPKPPPPTDSALENGVPKTKLSASRGEDIVYTMQVPEDASNIRFEISGGTGDADLYVKFNALATDDAYDCRPFAPGNNEVCNGANAGGTYSIRLKAYRSFAGVSLIGSYQ